MVALSWWPRVYAHVQPRSNCNCGFAARLQHLRLPHGRGEQAGARVADKKGPPRNGGGPARDFRRLQLRVDAEGKRLPKWLLMS